MGARVLWEHEAAGSSPVTPTIIYRSRRSGGETGIHTGLKIPRRKTYGFDSRPEHQMRVWWNGRHVRFRFWCRKACRFKSCHPHQTLQKRRNRCMILFSMHYDLEKTRLCSEPILVVCSDISRQSTVCLPISKSWVSLKRSYSRNMHRWSSWFKAPVLKTDVR